MKSEEINHQKIILFDGICNLCSNTVIFILKHEKEPALRFASIQSEAGGHLLAWSGLPEDFIEAIVFIDGGTVHLGSTAALHIGRHLRLPWSFLAFVGFLVPKPVRDFVYHQIALRRYRWFGKRDACMIPTEELKARFL